jgi:shikimate dehydrogenase
MIWQGAVAFKIWTGKDMPVDLIKKEIFGKWNKLFKKNIL